MSQYIERQPTSSLLRQQESEEMRSTAVNQSLRDLNDRNDRLLFTIHLLITAVICLSLTTATLADILFNEAAYTNYVLRELGL